MSTQSRQNLKGSSPPSRRELRGGAEFIFNKHRDTETQRLFSSPLLLFPFSCFSSLPLCGKKIIRATITAISTLLILSLTACSSAEIVPVELHTEDMCANCRMAISEKRFAAEFITKDGDAFKFDDLGCLTDYVQSKQNRDQIAAFFVMDYETKQWLKAEEATFVHSSKIMTPMSGNIVAFSDKAKAEASSATNAGRLMKFADLIGRAKKAGA